MVFTSSRQHRLSRGGASIAFYVCDLVCSFATAPGDAHITVDVCATREFLGSLGSYDHFDGLSANRKSDRSP
jgi:hypothetical protein